MNALDRIDYAIRTSKGPAVTVSRTDLQLVVDTLMQAFDKCPVEQMGIDVDKSFCDNVCTISGLCELTLVPEQKDAKP